MAFGSIDRETADARRRAAGEVCTYCGRACLDGRQRPEHPIPLVLGSRLTVFTVCDECNERAASEVDAPWLRNVFVQAERAKVGVVDPRHKATPTKDPILSGVFKDEDGHTVIVEDGVPRYPGSIVHAEDTATIAADTPERARTLLDRLRRQLAKDGQEIAGFSQKVRKEHRPRLSRNLSMSIADGVRMGAKLGLAFGAEAFDEGWRASAEAKQLRAWLWTDQPTTAEGEQLVWLPGTDQEHPFADPPIHTVYFDRLSVGTALIVLVFGTLGFALPVAPGSPPPALAWKIPLGGLPERTSYDNLMLWAMRKHLRAHEQA